jgi:hypothetical protein
MINVQSNLNLCARWSLDEADIEATRGNDENGKITSAAVADEREKLNKLTFGESE